LAVHQDDFRLDGLRGELKADANLAYVGSITIDAALIERVGLWPGERVLVVSNTSGARLETYVIEGEHSSGAICVNGAAAHLIGASEEIIITRRWIPLAISLGAMPWQAAGGKSRGRATAAASRQGNLPIPDEVNKAWG
jgi:hypothetical protein